MQVSWYFTEYSPGILGVVAGRGGLFFRIVRRGQHAALTVEIREVRDFEDDLVQSEEIGVYGTLNGAQGAAENWLNENPPSDK